MPKKINWTEIAKYVSGNSSSTKRKIIEKKMLAEENFRQKVEEAQRAWKLSSRQAGKWNTDKAWNEVHKKLSSDESPSSAGRKSFSSESKNKRDNRFSLTYMVRIAAIVLLGAFIGIIYYQTTSNSKSTQVQEKQKPKQLVAKKGEQKRFHLSDGTSITLAPDSKVQLPADYITGTRKVYLKGEAYFEVTSNPDHPFEVHANGTVTKVLGTQFNVVSYPGDQAVQVVVVEGNVELREAKSDNRILLNPGELGSYHSDKKLTIQKAEISNHVGWLKGQLVFDNQSLNEVVTRLERWYALSFNIDNPEIENRKLTATYLRRQPLSEVLDAIALSLDITYTKNGSTVTFNKNNK
jgi:ferric-dicitrate binding protein FerR (iron transport regulator)